MRRGESSNRVTVADRKNEKRAERPNVWKRKTGEKRKKDRKRANRIHERKNGRKKVMNCSFNE